MARIKLLDLCHARSGDKGRHATVGLIAWDPSIFSVLVEKVTPSAIAAHFGDLVKGSVRCYPMPGISAISIVLEDALDGGGVRSLRLDAQGKAVCEAMLLMEIDVEGWQLDGVRLRPAAVPSAPSNSNLRIPAPAAG